MRALLLLCVAAVPALSQIGIFSSSGDIGGPALKGAAEYDPATKQYRITGTGTDIWARADQFHYVWREITGNFVMTATAKFLTEGIAHRKGVLMLRRTTDTDSPHVALAIHGDGTPALQFRTAKGDTTNTVDFPTEGPGVWKLRMARRGSNVTLWAAKDGGAMRELGHTMYSALGPVLLGLGVSSHSKDALNTVQFSDVSVEAEGALGVFSQSGDVGAPAIKGSTSFDAATGQYRVTGGGANIWAKQDQFQYVWREMTGNFSLSSTVKFLGEGNAHRKAGIMVRQSLDTDSAYADIMIHGNGMPGLQWRPRKGEDTNTFDLPFTGPATYRIKFVRTGVKMFLYIAAEGGEPVRMANTEVSLTNPVLVGLAVCSHQAENADTVIFSDVKLETP